MMYMCMRGRVRKTGESQDRTGESIECTLYIGHRDSGLTRREGQPRGTCTGTGTAGAGAGATV